MDSLDVPWDANFVRRRLDVEDLGLYGCDAADSSDSVASDREREEVPRKPRERPSAVSASSVHLTSKPLKNRP